MLRRYFFFVSCFFWGLSAVADDFHFVDSTFCPLICDPTVDQQEGFVIDILRDALATEGHTLTFSIVPYVRALTMVRNGLADGLPSIYHADAPDLLVGETVISPGFNQFFVRDDSSWRFTEESDWLSLNIAVVDGYTFAHDEFDQYLQEAKATGNRQVVFMSGDRVYDRLIKMLLAKRVDAVVDDNAFIFYALQKHRLTADTDAAIISAGRVSAGENVVAYSPAKPEQSRYLATLIDGFVGELYESGGINRYLSVYGLKLDDGMILPLD